MSAPAVSERSRWRGLTARERRTIAIGATVSVVALVFAYGILPFARRWQAREARLETQIARLARVRGLQRAEPRLAAALQAREAGGGGQLLAARTPALAAAALQAMLQQAAAESRVQVQRVDVASEPDTTGGAPAIPATLSAQADVYGLGALLQRVQHQGPLVEITALGVQTAPGPRGEALLQLTLSLRAPWRAE